MQTLPSTPLPYQASYAACRFSNTFPLPNVLNLPIFVGLKRMADLLNFADDYRAIRALFTTAQATFFHSF
jgi:hypothetical protein